jgi:outer membrane immunogenic protein
MDGSVTRTKKSKIAKTLLATVSPAALLLTGGANAADLLPRKAAVYAPSLAPAYSWTGCYVGANGGYGWGKNDATRANSTTTTTFAFSSSPATSTTTNSSAPLGIDTHGGVYGGQVGCNYQFATNWVFGVEAMFDGANIKGSVLDPLSAANTIGVKTTFLGSATARLGFTVLNNQGLFYVKGGLGAAQNKWNSSLIGDFKEDRLGWTAGGGFEWAFTPQWSAFVEYDHYGFSGSGNTLSVTAVTVGTTTVDSVTSGKQNIDLVKAGVNFKFIGP